MQQCKTDEAVSVIDIDGYVQLETDILILVSVVTEN